MLVPPLVGTLISSQRLLRPSLWTAVALIAVAVATGMAYAAPAYTHDQPLRRVVRALQPAPDGSSVWEVGSTRARARPGARRPWRLDARAGRGLRRRPLGKAAAALRLPHVGALARPCSGGDLTGVRAVDRRGRRADRRCRPRQPGLTVSFLMPPGITPTRSNLPGVVRLGSWTATYVAIPAEGVLFRASVRIGPIPRARPRSASSCPLRNCLAATAGRGFRDWLPPRTRRSGPPRRRGSCRCSLRRRRRYVNIRNRYGHLRNDVR